MPISYPALTFPGAPTNGMNEVQRLTPGGTISGGHWHITFETQTTGEIAWNATAAVIQAALEALSNVAPGDVVVSGGPISSGTVDLTFAQLLGGIDRTQVTVDATALTGAAPTLTPSTVTAGVRGTYRGAQGGALLLDTTNGRLYQNSGTAWAPVWAEPPVV